MYCSPHLIYNALERAILRHGIAAASGDTSSGLPVNTLYAVPTLAFADHGEIQHNSVLRSSQAPFHPHPQRIVKLGRSGVPMIRSRSYASDLR